MTDVSDGVKHYIAGWFGGITGLVAGHPFDTIKSRLQTDGLRDGRVYKGNIHCVRHMVATEGIRSFYKGMASPMLGVAFINAIVFGVQGNMMKTRKCTLWNHTFTGAIAGGCQSIITSPMELIKLRMQVQTNPTDLFHRSVGMNNSKVYTDPWDALRKIYRQDNLRGVFKGFELTLVREIPGFGAYFATYDYMCGQFVRYKGNGATLDDISTLWLCLAGGSSGITAWIVSYPTDVVKSRMQVDGMYGKRKYNGIWDCCVKSVQEPEGYRIFFKGLTSTIIRGFAVNAATLPTVSLILRYWRSNSS